MFPNLMPPHHDPPVLRITRELKPISRRVRVLGLCLLNIALLVCAWLLLPPHQAEPKLIARWLGPCLVYRIEQKGGIFVLSCPNTAPTRLWPLPWEWPWIEDLPESCGAYQSSSAEPRKWMCYYAGRYPDLDSSLSR